MAAFDRLIRGGKVRALGASNLRVWRIAEANAVAAANGWTQYSVVEQRHTYFRPRHGADFGPQICIGDDLKDYCRARGSPWSDIRSCCRARTRGRIGQCPAQYAGPEADERLEALRAVACETGATPNQV